MTKRQDMTADIDWPVGEFYSCDETENLTHTSPEEALTYYIDDAAFDPESDISACIRKLCPITVTAFRRMTVDDAWIADVGADLADCAAEKWNEEHGGEDGQCDLDEKDIAAAGARFAGVVRELYATGTSWNCEACGSVELSAEQVEALMRAENPHWWEDSF